MTRQIAVLAGGLSAEREVSLNSGRQCAQALREAGYIVSEIDVTRDIAALVAALQQPKPDTAFNALHGRYGEDGCIQGLLNLLDIPYSHSGVLASALAMDKMAARRVFADEGIGIAEACVATHKEIRASDVLPRPYVIKPINEGSSVGVHIVLEGDDRPPLDDGDDDLPLMVERYIPGRELTVAVMGNGTETPRALAVTELRPVSGFYDYAAKYTDGKTVHIIPADVAPAVHARALDWAAAAHKALGCRGVSRSDFRYDDTHDELVMLEVNTQPGLTPTSLVPEQANHCGISFEDLAVWMIDHAENDR